MLVKIYAGCRSLIEDLTLDKRGENTARKRSRYRSATAQHGRNSYNGNDELSHGDLLHEMSHAPAYRRSIAANGSGQFGALTGQGASDFTWDEVMGSGLWESGPAARTETPPSRKNNLTMETSFLEGKPIRAAVSSWEYYGRSLRGAQEQNEAAGVIIK